MGFPPTLFVNPPLHRTAVKLPAAVLLVVTAAAVCRQVSAAPAIFAGQPLQRGQAPWLASIVKLAAGGRYEFVCGGALVSPNVVLTAAHCGVLVNSTDSAVLVNTTTWNDPRPFGHAVGVHRVAVNPAFNDTPVADVAVVILVEKLTGVPFVDMVSRDEAPVLEANGTRVATAGWGRTATVDTPQVANVAPDLQVGPTPHPCTQPLSYIVTIFGCLVGRGPRDVSSVAKFVPVAHQRPPRAGDPTVAVCVRRTGRVIQLPADGVPGGQRRSVVHDAHLPPGVDRRAFQWLGVLRRLFERVVASRPVHPRVGVRRVDSQCD